MLHAGIGMFSSRCLEDILYPMVLPLPKGSIKGGQAADKAMWQVGEACSHPP